MKRVNNLLLPNQKYFISKKQENEEKPKEFCKENAVFIILRGFVVVSEPIQTKKLPITGVKLSANIQQNEK